MQCVHYLMGLRRGRLPKVGPACQSWQAKMLYLAKKLQIIKINYNRNVFILFYFLQGKKKLFLDMQDSYFP